MGHSHISANPPTPAFLSFIFASTDGTVLNSTIIGPQSRKYFQVSTDSTTSGYSVVQNSQLESVAMIEWGNNPIVEIREIVARQQTSQFLPLSPDKSQVISILHARGRRFRWTPSDRYIELYSTSTANPRLFARISQRQSGIKLEITAEGVQIGLLEVCVVSALLLMSGHSID
ncbi:hypothetical protein C8J57DRAFT_1066756 [Mycena rebaudengoi]|nr:hypothetical protein C8J57DRAFT_1066756 [Mycena rebaudengoi]